MRLAATVDGQHLTRDVGRFLRCQKDRRAGDLVGGTPAPQRSPIAQFLAKGLVGKKSLVKVLGRGELTRAVTVRVHAFSSSAEAAITAAGGSVEKLPLPFAVRPPASGNALMNR